MTTAMKPLSSDVQSRFWSKVNHNGPMVTLRPDLGPCWVWGGRIDKGGYGRTTTGILAHRRSFWIAMSIDPIGSLVDHLCHTFDPDCKGGPSCLHRRCVNPAHMELVTFEENVRRGVRASRTHCVNGHPFDEKNTYFNTKRAIRVCRACSRNRSARYKARKA